VGRCSGWKVWPVCFFFDYCQQRKAVKGSEHDNRQTDDVMQGESELHYHIVLTLLKAPSRNLDFFDKIPMRYHDAPGFKTGA